MRRLFAVLACIVLLAGVSACARIPSDSQVGTITVDPESGAQTRVDAEGPKPGDGPDAIVRGFITAGASFNNNFSVARSFLTDSLAAEWNPTSSVKIVKREVSLDSVTTNIATDSQTVSFEIPVSSGLDERGVFHENEADTSATMEFHLRQVNGEWRISEAPDGLLVSRTNFDNMFRPLPLHFYTPDFNYLVPDLRWFLRTSSTATDMVRATLDGPASYLAGAVVSPIPDNTSLTPQSVTTHDGQADVGLSATGLDSKTRERIFTQLETTLLSLGSVTSLELQTPDASLTSGVPASTKTTAENIAVAISQDSLVLLSGNERKSIDKSPRMDGGKSPAVSTDGQSIAWLSKTNREINFFDRENGSSNQILVGRNFVGPSFDRFGWVWTVDRDGSDLLAVRSSGELARIKLSFVNNKDVRAVRVSPDGTRIIVLSHSKDQSRMDVVGISRDGDNKPTKLTGDSTLKVATGFKKIEDVSWAGSQDLAMLAARTAEEPAQPYIQKVGGTSEALGTVSEGVSITSGGDTSSVRVGTRNGELFTYTSGSWQRLLDSDIRDPAYPG